MIKAIVVTVLVGLLSACGQNEAPAPVEAPPAPAVEVVAEPVVEVVTISSLKLGKAVSASSKVEADTVGFFAKDTVFAGVELSGKGPAVLKATWMYVSGDEVSIISEAEKTIEATGDTMTEFHISNPSGLPAGDYKVEVKINDAISETKSFSVS